MRPQPKSGASDYTGSGKLRDKAALITGGDSGIGRAVAVLHAKEGADVSIVYLNEHKDARETKRLVEAQGRKCVLLAGDIGQEKFCRSAVAATKQELGPIDILVNTMRRDSIRRKALQRSASGNWRKLFGRIFSRCFSLQKRHAAHFKKGGVIINCAWVTAYQGSPELLDYSATKGAIVAFTRSLTQALADKKIRVNAVAPGTDLDAADSGNVSGERGSDIWLRHAARARGRPQRSGDLVRVSGVGRLVLHDGTGLAPEWRTGCERLI